MHGGEFVVPNRIFVGGIPKHVRFIEQFQLLYGFNLNFFNHNTKKVNENELKGFFSSFGQVKDTRIINDGVGVSKG
jgi:RNA recognition motif-containing protein